jgi:hypothetical protein
MNGIEHFLWKLFYIATVAGCAYAIISICSGCSATLPLGERGKYGAISVEVDYIPPDNILATQPNIGGFAK